ncbi:MAG: hypothetical protein RBU21_03085 [FCB group bacterium]|nr:hypothetical protein [FCB group bacterium]
MLNDEKRKHLADHFAQTFDLIESESDRGAAIVGSALLEAALDHVLAKHLLPAAERSDEIFERSYTFSMKIDLAYRIGVIRPHIRKVLHLVRTIRNDFAHSPVDMRFARQSVRNRVQHLCTLSGDLLVPLIDTLRERQLQIEGGVTGETVVKALGPRLAFSAVVAFHCAGLDYTLSEVAPIEPLD